jgi:superfamily II DNA or RNA helicase
MQWYKKKTLIIVPTIGLVSQMKSDFESYGYKGEIHVSTGGLSKELDISADIVITTWQSLDNGKSRVNKKWYDQFQVVIGDECHGAKATTLIKILSAMENTPYRFGTTGTLDNIELNKATIEGLFGAQYKTTTTRSLIDQGHVADIKIKCITLKYPDEIAKQLKGKTYQEEIDFLTTYEPRNEFIKNLALSLKGNKLVFFRLIDHGKELYDRLSDNPDVFYIAGDVGVSDREDIRKSIEDKQNAILVASLGTTSTGVSIKKLHHMIAASPSKSKIKVLQSIGRMLRQHETKEHAVLYDIVDDLSIKSHKNYTLKHFEERLKIYDSEKFNHKVYNVRI